MELAVSGTQSLMSIAGPQRRTRQLKTAQSHGLIYLLVHGQGPQSSGLPRAARWPKFKCDVD